MSNWQGANVEQAALFPTTTATRPKKTGETVEAALYRLHQAYEASMQCIIQVQKQQNNSETCPTIAQTARRTLEVALLQDKWMAHLAPKLSSSSSSFHCGGAAPPPNFPTSKGHTTTVRKLSYLSLVNYGDLLLMGISAAPTPHNTTLDRGVVQPLALLLVANPTSTTNQTTTINNTVWVVNTATATSSEQPTTEPIPDTLRLALLAYLDALRLDGSDPILWLKLASVARRLGAKFWRLQKYSLERAVTCLPNYEPPNRTALRALQEFGDVNMPPIVDTDWEPPQPDCIVLDLPRYSWSNLGRLLLRTCRETIQPAFVTLRLSQLLSMQPSTLAKVCDCLPDRELWKLGATCRALSTLVRSARALNETRRRQQPPDEAEEELQGGKEPSSSVPPPREELQGTRETSESSDTRVKRSSKRVKSQIESSEKRNERSNRRNSVEYCLLASTLGYTPQDPLYRKAVRKSLRQRQTANVPRQESGDAAILGFQEGQKDARLKDSSLRNFVDRFSKQSNLSPMACLFRFVSHAAIHIGDVLSSDPSGSAVAASCLLDCLKLMGKQKLSNCLVPCWSLSLDLVPKDSRLKIGEVFALDLLHAELRLKICEGSETLDCGFDGDANFVSTVVPRLLTLVNELKFGSDEIRDVMRIRCHWLAASFFLWRRNLTSNVAESREAETEGLKLIEETRRCLNVSTMSMLSTPHLVSPQRKGQHWRYLSDKTLTGYADEIQAASIVLQAQEQFFRATAKFEGGDGSSVLNEDDSKALLSIGESLLARYSTSVESPTAKYSELIDDILESFNPTGPDETLQQWLDRCFPEEMVKTVSPLKRLASAPSILMIMVACLKTKPDQLLTLVRLFTRLGLAVIDVSESVASISTGANHALDANGSFDLDVEMDDNHRVEKSELGITETKLHQYACLLEWLLITIKASIETDARPEEIFTLVTETRDFSNLLRRSLEYVGHCCQYLPSQMELDESMATSDLDLYRATQSLFKEVERILNPEHEQALKSITRTYWWGSVEIILSQRSVLTSMSKPKGSSGRADWYRKQRSRADLVAAVCCDAGLLLSRNLMTVSYPVIERSFLFIDSETACCCSNSLARLCDTLLWFWKISSATSGSDENEKNAKDAVSFEKFGRERLRVPVATAIVGLCGAATAVDRLFLVDVGERVDSKPPLFEDFFDSDTSSVRCAGTVNQKDRELLKALSLAVHCACNVFGRVGESDATNYSYLPEYMLNPQGPPLALVMVRILNKFASHLLTDFSENDPPSRVAIWSDYPFGTRAVGMLLDSMLYKAYKCLYGFTLTNVADSKDSISTPTKSVSDRVYSPESTKAVADLYRCIMRAYGNGRKTPPKVALDFVSASLPVAKEDQKGEEVRRFLFSSSNDSTKLGRIVGLAMKRGDWETKARKSMGFEIDRVPTVGVSDEDQDEVTAVRRGLSNLIAQGSLPRYQDSGDLKELRSSSAQAEEELSKKFLAILESICFGELCDCEAWFKASQCLTMKADIVADRLGLSCGFTRSNDFAVRQWHVPTRTRTNLAELELQQERESRLNEEATVYTLGNDLSVYVRHSWSSFDSLQACAAEIGSSYKSSDCKNANPEDQYHANVWRQLETLFLKKEFSSWQQGWGGLFVSSLRMMAYRCLTLALYSAYKSSSDEDNSSIETEILESLGVNLYTDIMGSQSYGFPLREMTAHQKREIADAALTCFERSIETARSSNNDTEDGEIRVVWDLLFMAGKCHEKIANTYKDEAFPDVSSVGSDASSRIRRYESRMALAFQSYVSSFAEATELEKGGGFIAEENGGSAHGSAEVFYRLHASRLKCLISAVDRHEDDRQQAEEEALRLAERHWYTPIGEDSAVLPPHRDRIWRVLVDVVDALARCRLDNSYFHRSVYRHAQALMWAPILYDPVGARAKGSLGNVSAVYASKIRGLNYATDAASSALSIINALFGKKRPQLVAVWVTGDGTTSAFQTINNSSRKYDSLRGKYILAYIECLRCCRQRKELDTLLRWIASSNRDLPSYFAVSAGTNEVKPHGQDSLVIKNRSLESFYFLTSIKRETNAALASVILHDLKNAPTGDESTKKHQKYLDDQFKIAYACFLRLKWDPTEQSSSRNSTRHQRRHGTKEVIEALTSTYLKILKDKPPREIHSDWSGESQISVLMEAALKKCKENFPNLSSTYSFSKARAPSKKNSDKDKRKDGPANTQHFEVAVPEGLGEGETFMASIQVGSTLKKVRLTVPSAGITTLRFSLEVPDQTEERPAKKPKPGPEDSAAVPKATKHGATGSESPAAKKPRTEPEAFEKSQTNDQQEYASKNNISLLSNVTIEESDRAPLPIAPQGGNLTSTTVADVDRPMDCTAPTDPALTLDSATKQDGQNKTAVGDASMVPDKPTWKEGTVAEHDPATNLTMKKEESAISTSKRHAQDRLATQEDQTPLPPVPDGTDDKTLVPEISKKASDPIQQTAMDAFSSHNETANASQHEGAPSKTMPYSYSDPSVGAGAQSSTQREEKAAVLSKPEQQKRGEEDTPPFDQRANNPPRTFHS